jgi:hypothetical protein
LKDIAGHEVMVEVDHNSALIAGNPQGIVGLTESTSLILLLLYHLLIKLHIIYPSTILSVGGTGSYGELSMMKLFTKMT